MKRLMITRYVLHLDFLTFYFKYYNFHFRILFIFFVSFISLARFPFFPFIKSISSFISMSVVIIGTLKFLSVNSNSWVILGRISVRFLLLVIGHIFLFYYILNNFRLCLTLWLLYCGDSGFCSIPLKNIDFFIIFSKQFNFL